MLTLPGRIGVVAFCWMIPFSDEAVLPEQSPLTAGLANS